MYYCQYFFSDICVFDSSDSEHLHAWRGFSRTHAFSSVLFLDIYNAVSDSEHPIYLSVLFPDPSISVSSDSEHPVYLPVLLPDTSFCRVDFPDSCISPDIIQLRLYRSYTKKREKYWNNMRRNVMLFFISRQHQLPASFLSTHM